MTGTSAGWSLARVAALALVAAAASLAWVTSQRFQAADGRPIWLEPGAYQGPPDATLDPSQVDAIAERARQLTF
jgi:hypothetical protein